MLEEPPILYPSEDAFAWRLLPPITGNIDASAQVTCLALLEHAHQATDLLLSTTIDSRLVPGRWRAIPQGMGMIHYELVEGPLQALSLHLHVQEQGSGALLRIEGAYFAALRPVIERRRGQQLAEALRNGLALRIQHALARQTEQRAAPRRLLAVPARLRVGDVPLAGTTRDVSVGGLGLLIHATPGEAPAFAARILAHTGGAVELLADTSRLTARVQIVRVQPCATGLDVGLRYGVPDEGVRLQLRLADLNLWDRQAEIASYRCGSAALG